MEAYHCDILAAAKTELYLLSLVLLTSLSHGVLRMLYVKKKKKIKNKHPKSLSCET